MCEFTFLGNAQKYIRFRGGGAVSKILLASCLSENEKGIWGNRESGRSSVQEELSPKNLK